MLDIGSIENSDISLCVLSLPEVLTTGENGEPEIQLPPSISSLATPSTIFLLNKSDLVSSTSSLGWTASLATEEGMPEFMSGFSKLLHERYVSPCFSSTHVNGGTFQFSI